MKKQNTHERVRLIYELLFEMAQGNFVLKIPVLDNGDELDKISISLNDLSTQLSKIITNLGSTAHQFTFKAVLEPLIVVQDNFNIKSFRPHLPHQLGYDHKSFNELNFLKIVAPESQDIFNYVNDNLSDNYSITKKFKLVFIGKNKQELHFYCTLEKHSPGNNIIISSVGNLFELATDYNVETGGETEKANIFEVYDYIIKNFNKPLPTTKELSIMFKMNEFQIKDDFRKTFKTSIYQLYTEVRLKFAHDLIENTGFQLSEVAAQSGYSNYVSFLRAFLIKYKCKPTEIKRKGQ